jgi:uncharacterized protein
MLVRCMVLVLRVYRALISPLLGPVCRFHPSCSRYAEQCLLVHGPIYGSLLSIKRLAKCHPFHPGGYDPVPPRDHHNVPRLGHHHDSDSLVKAIACSATPQEGPR